METSLASLLAKYARECAMTLFNTYWLEKGQDLKGTAGYYTDGRRFLKDLDLQGLIPENRDSLKRVK